MDLDLKSALKSNEKLIKDMAEIELEQLKSDLDSVGIPKCPICATWFPNTEVIKRHIGSIHEGQRIAEPEKQNTLEEMEKSHQSGYGETEGYHLVAVQCKKCDETLLNNHLLRIHMRKHVRKESKILKCKL